MSSNLIGVIVGIAFVFPAVYLVRKQKFDQWFWPITLATLPIYYMLFGLLVLDSQAILMELLYGLPYIATGLLVWRLKSKVTVIIIAIAWLSHGFYDYYHDVLFINLGVFAWYPAFCGIVDIVVGSYLLIFSQQIPTSKQH